MRFALLSDLHLIPRPGAERFFNYGDVMLDARAQFAETVAALRAVAPAPELLLLNGDLTNEGDGESYRFLRDQLRPLCPRLHALPGNHDDQQQLRAVFPAPGEKPARLDYSFEWGDALFVLLDSTVAESGGNAIHGALGAEQLDWLQRTLRAHGRRETLIFLHHPPLDVGIAWMDELKLRNAGEFFDCLAGQPQVRAIFYGHLHHYREDTHNGIRLISVPSASFWFPAIKEQGIPLRAPEFLVLDRLDGELTIRRVPTSIKGLHKAEAPHESRPLPVSDCRKQ